MPTQHPDGLPHTLWSCCLSRQKASQQSPCFCSVPPGFPVPSWFAWSGLDSEVSCRSSPAGPLQRSCCWSCSLRKPPAPAVYQKGHVPLKPCLPCRGFKWDGHCPTDQVSSFTKKWKRRPRWGRRRMAEGGYLNLDARTPRAVQMATLGLGTSTLLRQCFGPIRLLI